jgi:hypothetical protein
MKLKYEAAALEAGAGDAIGNAFLVAGIADLRPGGM